MNQPAAHSPTDVLPALQAYVSSMRRKIAAMELLKSTGDQLLDSISRGDTQSLARILEQRAAACHRVSEACSAVPPLDLDPTPLIGSPCADVREAAAAIIEGHRRAESLAEQTMATQAKCEETLRTALVDTARQLKATVGQRKITSAYQLPQSSVPRYLDSRK